MARFQHPLDNISVAAPCSADWDSMIGTDQSRFCGQCSKNVYNLSGMTRGEAEELITRSEGQLCVRFYRRADGSVLTQNCPVGLAAVRARVKRRVTAVLASVLSFFSGVGIFAAFGSREGSVMERVGQRTVGTMVAPREGRQLTMGGISPATDFQVGEMEVRTSRRAPRLQRR
ncbi:MAG: hypothetical protein ABIP75_19345 [Pyrinomonadaceae bacterium]